MSYSDYMTLQCRVMVRMCRKYNISELEWVIVYAASFRIKHL